MFLSRNFSKLEFTLSKSRSAMFRYLVFFFTFPKDSSKEGLEWDEMMKWPGPNRSMGLAYCPNWSFSITTASNFESRNFHIIASQNTLPTWWHCTFTSTTSFWEIDNNLFDKNGLFGNFWTAILCQCLAISLHIGQYFSPQAIINNYLFGPKIL